MTKAAMNDIAKARARVNQRVARYVQLHPEATYSQIAEKLGVSRWRVLMVAGGMGISRKTGPKSPAGCKE
jgi:DNA-binding transcriptional regulator LsrR (DeoR family)